MEALGLPCPESLFGSVGAALSTLGSIIAALDKLGPKATMAQIVKGAVAVGAGGPAITAAGRVLLGAGAVLASYYVGACIGSLAVATGRSLSGGMSIADIFDCAKRHGIPTPAELQKTLIAFPEICNADLRGGARIALRKAQWAKLAVA